jgi:adenylosuccinate synthase
MRLVRRGGRPLLGRINGLDALALTKLDVLDGLPEVLICTGYRTGVGTLTEFPADLRLLAGATPLYERMPGWSRPTRSATRIEDLPVEARRYVEKLEDVSGVPCAIISTGSDRNETIVKPHSIVERWLGTGR